MRRFTAGPPRVGLKHSLSPMRRPPAQGSRSVEVGIIGAACKWMSVHSVLKRAGAAALTHRTRPSEAMPSAASSLREALGSGERRGPAARF